MKLPVKLLLAACAAAISLRSTQAVAAPLKVSYSGSLASTPIDVAMAGVVSAEMAPQISLAASSKLTMGTSDVPNMVVLDLHASVETPVCEVQQLTFKVQGTFSMPGLTNGKSCLAGDTCFECYTGGLEWDEFLPTVACETSEPSLVGGSWPIPELTAVLPITQSDLSVKLSDLTQEAAPEIASMLKLTGSDVIWSIPLNSIKLYLAGGSFQVQMKAEVMNLKTSTMMTKLPEAVQKVVDSLVSGIFTDNTLYSDTLNIGAEVRTLLQDEKTSVPSWLQASGAIAIGDVSKADQVCDTTPRKFAVNVTGLTADELKTNTKSIQQALAKLLTKQADAHSDMPVLPTQLTDLAMCGTDSKALCGNMMSGAGLEAGGLNDYLAQLAATKATVPVASGSAFTLEGIVAKDTDFTCSAAAEEAGGCPKAFVPGGGGGNSPSGGGGGSGGGGNSPSGGGGGNTPSSGGTSSSSGRTTHAMTSGDVAAIVLGTLAVAAIAVIGVLRVQRGSFGAVFRRNGAEQSSRAPAATSASAAASPPGRNVVNPLP